MRKWSGGTLIVALSVILVIRYSLVEKDSRKHSSAYKFFRNHPPSGSNSEDNGRIKPSQPQLIPNNTERAFLISVDGLSDLFSLINISKEEAKVVVVWAQMRSLLSRSDYLPETTQGIKEASIAWKDLLSTIEKEKTSRFMNSSSHGYDAEDKNCSFSVSMSNKTISRKGSSLQFPCGLIEDSSITVVGIPDGSHGSFQIELIGSKLKGEPKPPVVLYYNVSLPGDELKEDPVIVQNAWTAENGWGKEEKCPAHSSTSNLEVDGLVRCNEQVVIEENLNGSQPSGEKLANISKGLAHMSYNFPFVEGNPFTATLWVGPEGFHMTVNGRHETSFAYREKLEPWLVSEVKVRGGLDLLSALANGLPVSEDLDLIDIEHLKAPLLSRKRLVMLVGVFSTGNNFERRMALRRSWMQYGAVRSGDVAVRFFVGLHKNSKVNVELWREAQTYGDIQLMPFVDYYSLITLKTIAICLMGTKILPAKYIMKTDDDAFVRIDEVLAGLKGKVSNGLFYGLISFDSEPIRERDSKWYISVEEWPHATYPPWAHGPGYILSRDIAKFIVQGHHERYLKLFKLEDVAMGIWIDQFKKNGQEVHYMTDDRFKISGCEENYILAHYQNPSNVLCLWEKLQKEHEPLCCD
ncbi:Galectin [Macleaya cordata]|uniref:Galectin n=1 Tax=Macleaya cordata TaxID=56857 RepID=A0A200R1Y7_MACCD|nr:Galectin [Macleaya cordata]